MEAVRETARRCRAKRLDASGVTQIKVLVSAKSAVSYGDESTSYELAVKLAVAAQRFETWVYKRMEEAA
jgi:hypothetical protein